jgi:predicted RND superfamily exporter protein
MSGDKIANLKILREPPLNPEDFLYAQRLLEPFDDISHNPAFAEGKGADRSGDVVERFSAAASTSTSPRTFGFVSFVAICLVLLINFPSVRDKSGLNPYIVWLVSLLLLFGIVYQ